MTFSFSPKMICVVINVAPYTGTTLFFSYGTVLIRASRASDLAISLEKLTCIKPTANIMSTKKYRIFIHISFFKYFVYEFRNYSPENYSNSSIVATDFSACLCMSRKPMQPTVSAFPARIVYCVLLIQNLLALNFYENDVFHDFSFYSLYLEK